MKKILLKGPIFTTSGYGVHANQIYKALSLRKDIDLHILPTNWGQCSWDLNIKYIDDILKCCRKNINIEFDESYQVLLPNEWKNIAKLNIGITAGFEGNYVKKEWINCVNRMDYVFVPSEFSKKSFINTSNKCNLNIDTEIKVYNEWFYEDFLKDTSKEYNFLKKVKFNKNILIAGQISSPSINDRKNIVKTIKAVYDSIKSNSEIGIILKVNSGSYSNINKIKLINMLKENLNDKILTKTQVLFGYGSIDEMKYLYESNKILCLVTGTRAEGWGLHLLEAAACGLPIIATDYSAYKEFLVDKFLKIKYELVNVDKEIYGLFLDDNNVQWAEFSYDNMIENIQILIKNFDFYKEKAKDLQEIIKQRYSINHIINDYKLFFESLY